MSLQAIDSSTAGKILDFSGGDKSLQDLARLQLEGAVAAHNMIADPTVGMAYIADEVGMGKTYIALGVVALMRYFNPSLRVLFICPSANVQEKWFGREYRSFIERNVTVDQFRVRTPDGKSAAPAESCGNLVELIYAASRGYVADYFVRMTAFSMGLTDESDQWRRRLCELNRLLPAHPIPETVDSKASVKEQYARALNYLLPTFDLVVIDEAHNFKHDFNSSDRNKVLSSALGFYDTVIYESRVRHALLLSATPYDRDLEQLRNQLRIVGKHSLLPENVADEGQHNIRQHLSKFLIRRLNELDIAGQPHTRNMYRREQRSDAEIKLNSDEQKLVAALVQKKVGEMLDKKGDSPSFQTGLLASFESYAQTAGSEPVEFDGDPAERHSADAEDRHVVDAISGSYVGAGLGNTLPHPKMDAVSQQLAEDMLQRGKKQIVFVRRVKSVRELKHKLDDLYNRHLFRYLKKHFAGRSDAESAMDGVIAEYKRISRFREDDVSGGDFNAGKFGDDEDRQPPKNDTLFAWFFRGEPPINAMALLAAGEDSFTTPFAMRTGLTAKNQVISALFEINWASMLCDCLGENLDGLIANHSTAIAQWANEFTIGTIRDDQLEIYLASQLGFLKWAERKFNLPGIQRLIDHLKPRKPRGQGIEISSGRVAASLRTHTLFDALRFRKMLDELFPLLCQSVKKVALEDESNLRLLQKLDIHGYLLSLCLRTGHGVIDLYIARLMQGPANLTESTRKAWMDEFAEMLDRQRTSSGFSTWHELRDLANNLDLIIKTNVPDVYDRSPEEYRRYFSRMLNPVAPIVGATGKTTSTRTAQARKFRMPGYPLVLVSTDVFQEGEDLHNFCDSVVHYGLSGSPVSIEQKIGRVDRVASLAQRRLRDIRVGKPGPEQLIQVSFPFVRESIETLQVRQLCQNMNAFLRSMHEVGHGNVETVDVVDATSALLDRTDIPELIQDPLKSPYVPERADRISSANLHAIVEEQAHHSRRTLDNLKRRLKEQFGRDPLDAEGLEINDRRGERRAIFVSVSSARASGEILLKAEIEGEILNLGEMGITQLLRRMEEESWRTFHRTYAREIANRRFRLYHDAEMLIGDEQATLPIEIKQFFERFSLDHNPGKYCKPRSDIIRKYWSQAATETNIDFSPEPLHIENTETYECLHLTFQFGSTRKQDIAIYESHDRCIFLSKAAAADMAEKMPIDQLIRLTWQRNAQIDIVEFMLDDKARLVGRAVHPVCGLNLKEFLFCAYTLAVSTDRLEYTVHKADRF